MRKFGEPVGQRLDAQSVGHAPVAKHQLVLVKVQAQDDVKRLLASELEREAVVKGRLWQPEGQLEVALDRRREQPYYRGSSGGYVVVVPLEGVR